VSGGSGLPTDRVRLSRRALLRSSTLVLGLEPSGVLGPLWRRVQDSAARVVSEAHAEQPALRLSEPELEDLIAFTELLVEGRPLSPIEQKSLVENIGERVAREQDYLDLYRTTVSLLQRLAGRRFASLAPAERIALITRHKLNSTDVRPGDDLGLFPDDMRVVRTRALRDLIADYYNSPAGWAVVGYDVFPGRCGDLWRYTRPES
jgi:hypothetical protein